MFVNLAKHCQIEPFLLRRRQASIGVFILPEMLIFLIKK